MLHAVVVFLAHFPPFIQTGMMKEHVRGPTKFCETLAEDMLRIARAEALVYHQHFKAAELNSIRRGDKIT